MPLAAEWEASMTDLEKIHSMIDGIMAGFESIQARIVEIDRGTSNFIRSHPALFTEDEVADAQSFIDKHGDGT